MARDWQQPPPRKMFRGSELRLLATAILVLVMLYMLMARWSGRDVAVEQVQDDSASHSALTPTPLPKGEGTIGERRSRLDGLAKKGTPPLGDATGPTDEDPLERAEAKQEFLAVTDGAESLSAIDMEAYYRLASWVESQSFARLKQRAQSRLLYTHFHDEPGKYRGRLVTLHLNVGKVIDAGDNNRLGIDLHEVWGRTKESGNRLYVAIVLDYPKDMPVGTGLNENVEFAGYFLKLQGCGDGQGHAEKVPLLIGRLQWEPPTSPRRDNRLELILAAMLLVVVAAAVGIRFALRKRKPSAPLPTPRGLAVSPSGEALPIETWLEQGNLSSDESEDLDHET
jgi:hypothetical protein